MRIMIKQYLLPCFLTACLALSLCAADNKPAAKDEGITRQQADAILSELKAIHELLAKAPQAASAPAVAAAPAPDPKASLKLEGAEILGSKTAPITVVEFTDYQCPFCRQFHTTTFDQIRQKYVDSGKVRFVTIDFPLDFHANAEKAAEAGHCANEQGQFWRMRDVLSQNADKLEAANLPTLAQSLYLDVPAFKSCLDAGKYKQLVLDNIKQGTAAGVVGTPSFVIGTSTPDGVDGVLFVGAQPFDAFDAKIKEFVGK
jgi:protein-disulfide isomerase